jgi:hypothetical protein
MGAALIRWLVLFLVAALLTGCGRMSDESVRDKDRQRMQVADSMPGNDIPPDPADR